MCLYMRCVFVLGEIKKEWKRERGKEKKGEREGEHDWYSRSVKANETESRDWRRGRWTQSVSDKEKRITRVWGVAMETQLVPSPLSLAS